MLSVGGLCAAKLLVELEGHDQKMQMDDGKDATSGPALLGSQSASWRRCLGAPADLLWSAARSSPRFAQTSATCIPSK